MTSVASTYSSLIYQLNPDNSVSPVSVTNPFPIYDAYLNPVVTTWNSSTAVNSVIVFPTAGMDTVALTINPTGTFVTGSLIFEVFDGAAWISVKSARLSSYNTDSTFTLPNSTLQGWTVPAAGYPQFRVRLTTAITGTSPSAVITGIVSSAPDTSIVTVGLDPTQAMHPGGITLQAEQVLAVGASSVQSAVTQTTTSRVVLSSTTGCWVAFGSSPTASAATGSIYLPPNVISTPYVVTGGVTKIAVIQASAAGSLSIQESL